MSRMKGLLFWTWVILSGLWVAFVWLVTAEPHPHAPFSGVPLSWIVAAALAPPALLLGAGLLGARMIRAYRRRS
jgi:hypothetical protein